MQQLLLFISCLYISLFYAFKKTSKEESDDNLQILTNLGHTNSTCGTRITDNEKPVMYHTVRNELLPNNSEESYILYESRLSEQMNNLANKLSNYIINTNKSFSSNKLEEEMYASKPYAENDLSTRYPAEYPVIIHSSVCDSSGYQVILGIPVSPSQFAERFSIRKTWCNRTTMEYTNIVCIFFTSQSEISTKIDKFVKEEANKYNDIVQFGFRNSYLNITLLQMLSYKWSLDHCKSYKYYIRADSDTFINTNVIERYIIPFPHKQFAYGMLINGGLPIRHHLSKYFLPMWLYPKQKFDPYFSGCMYIWSRDIVELIVNGSNIIRPIHYIDDVYYGQIFNYYKIKLIPDKKYMHFNPIPFSVNLWNNTAGSHRFTPIDLLALWNIYSNYYVCKTR